MKKMYNKIKSAIVIAYYVFKNHELFTNEGLKLSSKILQLMFEAAEQNSPLMTHIMKIM